jgi:hypothetical protein
MVSQLHDVPGTHQAQASLRAHAAATNTEKSHVFIAPFKARIKSVSLVFDAAITGANTNTTHVNLINAGTAGSGTTEIGNIDYVNGTNAAAGATVALYAPATPLEVDAGTKLAIQHEKVGNGLDIPAALVVISYEGA